MASQPAPSKAPPRPISQPVRTALSLALVVHGFVLLVVLAGNLSPSALEVRLLELVRPYARTFNLELDGTAYYLTHGSDVDTDHRVELLPRGEEESADVAWVGLPESGFRGGEAYHRQQRLVEVMGFFSEGGNDDVTAMLAASMARHYVESRGMDVEMLRCRRRQLPFLADLPGLTRGERDALVRQPPWQVVYRAQVIAHEGGVDIVKRADDELEASPDRPDGDEGNP